MIFSELFHHLYEKLLGVSGSKTKIRYLRRIGVKIGENCRIHTVNFSTEPFLIEVGNHVTIAGGTIFITHEGSVWCFHNEIDGGIFGKIKIGDNVFVGSNCIILYNTVIGNNCIIGSGSVVRGVFPDNSVIMGNPAKVVYKTNIQKLLFNQNPGLLKTNNLTPKQSAMLIKEHFKIE